MKSIDDWSNDFEQKPVATSIKAVAIVVAVCIVIAVPLMIIGGVFTAGNAALQGEVNKAANPGRVQSKVFDPNNTIAQVKFFHDTCTDIVAKTSQIAQLQADIAQRKKDYNPSADPLGQGQQAITQQENNLTGLMQQRENVAQNYNSRSAQYTANPFKSAGLPYRIGPPNGVAYESINCH